MFTLQQYINNEWFFSTKLFPSFGYEQKSKSIAVLRDIRTCNNINFVLGLVWKFHSRKVVFRNVPCQSLRLYRDSGHSHLDVFHHKVLKEPISRLSSIWATNRHGIISFKIANKTDCVTYFTSDEFIINFRHSVFLPMFLLTSTSFIISDRGYLIFQITFLFLQVSGNVAFFDDKTDLIFFNQHALFSDIRGRHSYAGFSDRYDNEWWSFFSNIFLYS